MAVFSYTSPIAHVTDVDFRTWGQELNTNLAAAGLVQAADTGQIDWVTVTKPANNTDAGSEIWRFNDSLQGAAPIYFKLFFGTGNSANSPRIRLRVGQGSDGVGGLTGRLGALTTVSPLIPGLDTVTSRTSFIVVGEGYLVLSWKESAFPPDAHMGFFVISRSTTNLGVLTTEAAHIIYGGKASADLDMQTLTFDIDLPIFSITKLNSLVPGNLTESLTLPDFQFFPIWLVLYENRQLFSACSVFVSELPFGTIFSTTIVGASPRTYRSVGNGTGRPSVANNTTLFTLAVIWE